MFATNSSKRTRAEEQSQSSVALKARTIGKNCVRDGCSGSADEEDGTAANAIGPAAEQRQNKLQSRERGHEGADFPAGRALKFLA